MTDEAVQRRIDIVRNLYESFGNIDPDELTNLFTEDGYVQPMMKDPYSGRDEIHQMFTIWATGYSNVDTPLRNLVGQGDVVVAEWLDVSDFEGQHYELPSVGVFEFEGEKIKAWRLYYDYALEAPQEGRSGLKPRRTTP